MYLLGELIGDVMRFEAVIVSLRTLRAPNVDDNWTNKQTSHVVTHTVNDMSAG